MKRRGHEWGFDFPFDQVAAEALAAGETDFRHRIDTIEFKALDAMILREGLRRDEELSETLRAGTLFDCELIERVVTVLKKLREEEILPARLHLIDRLVSKCRESQKRGVAIGIEV